MPHEHGRPVAARSGAVALPHEEIHGLATIDRELGDVGYRVVGGGDCHVSASVLAGRGTRDLDSYRGGYSWSERHVRQ
ncbi:hypothetical protein GCM10010272_66760 [Streptomyces lateritius]|nr:hypothetical protein GCM10010272_66760 [Streptomyces lateritius]